MVDRIFSTMGALKIGKYVIIEDHPCRIVSVDKSKPGKHGAAKVSAVAISLFDDSKHSLMKSSDADCEVPIIERKRSQIVNADGSTATLMDKESYETFDVQIPEEMRSDVEVGKEIQYMEVMGKRLLLRID
ncbi:translation initiation factor IF-5A [Candidatus Micrarchaeota archaeon CG_4_10_14_0_2_um_filter_55_9]|nr:MAG: translation initiation factor IF-5A [Candidatus Micrarchaeota archaeon CG1_02_55_41]PIO03202.1 MAG: translation initiation factor IF-5A [Candidatus Micrarchaeota archaeon CG09_land_8_20_14_0_10_55_25]PIZ91616.1 MAG: translation initiation factor IF-5A [Candidatus Micrarchaeota archaeon CG_4_10_14_0_2_um_filter_55_9]PJD01155.1 MAG: translation initiation factor IF-5A [Candidatus Micrarchaeota archaeon CG10_big_fil_rev_8_21_14_0_10_54_18]